LVIGLLVYWLLDIGYWVSGYWVIGNWLLVIGYWRLVTGYWVIGYWVIGLENFFYELQTDH